MKQRAAIAGCVACIVLMVVVAEHARRRSTFVGDEHDLQAFIAAADSLPERLLEVRLSGGFTHRPLARSKRGDASGERNAFAAAALLLAAAPIYDTASATENARDLHVLGIVQLTLHRLATGTETLERALVSETRQTNIATAVAKTSNASLLSDLAAAYFLRSQHTNRPLDLMMAGECASRASRLDRRNAEAAWNRAVIFEAIGVRDVAQSAWADFLDLDSDSEWAVEARSRRRTLSAPLLATRWDADRKLLLDAATADNIDTVRSLVGRYPEQARTLVEEDLLGSWADARMANDDTRARVALDRAKRIGDAVARLSNDSLAHDATVVVAESPRSQTLIRGHHAYLAARILYKSGQHSQAQPMLAAAFTDLRAAGSPLAFRAGAYDITAKHYLGRHAEALAEGRALLQDLGGRAAAYPTAAGQLRWTCGLAAMALGSLDEAVAEHRMALASFQRTNETSNLAGVLSALCSDYRSAGDFEKAWTHQIQAIHLSLRYATFERAQVVIGSAAVTALRDGYVAVADEMQRGVLTRAREAQQAIFICDALIRRSEILAAMGLAAEARAAITEALSQWRSVPESAIKSRLRADLEVARTTISSDLRVQERISELDTAMEYVKKTNSRTRIARVLLLRARAHREAGDERMAERDLIAGIAEVEAQRERITSDELRSTFLNTAVALYDEMMQMHLHRGENVAAFDVLERRRARWLLDRFQGQGRIDNAPVLQWSELRAQIPSGVAVVSYALSTRIEAWIATPAALNHRSIDVPPESLAAEIAAMRSSMLQPTGTAERRRLAAALHRTLIEPIRADLAGVQAIVIIPDRFLNAVPFAALFDGRAGRYLVEDYALVAAPSLNLFVRCQARYRSAAIADSVLIVANPAMASDDESLQPLSGAEAEAATITFLYPNASLLAGAEATTEAFTQRLRRSSLVHFGGHAVINGVRPELSSLVLAPNALGGRSRLYARDIYGMNLSHAQLVVLAACESANGSEDADSPLSLATAFLAAGVPATIASLWPVDDIGSSVFFGLVYQNLRAGMSPANALREAQVASLRSNEVTEETWAAYQMIGGAVDAK